MKKIMTCLCLIALILLVGCKKKPDPTPTPGPGPTPSVVVESICVTDRTGTVIESDSVYQSGTRTYSHQELFVWAVYSDDTMKNVTRYATFSDVSILEPGDVVVTVTYKEFSTTYTVKVLANVVKSISLDYTNCKILYPVGAIFDPSGLVVRGSLADGQEVTLTEYDLSIKDSDVELTQPLSTPGKKNIVVSYGEDITATFEIMVYDQDSLNSYVYKMDYLMDELPLDENGNFEFMSSYEAMNNSVAKIKVNSTILKTKEESGNPVEHTYNTETYHSYIAIPTTEGIEITIPYQTDIFMVVADLYGTTVSFTKDNQVYEAFGHKSNYTSILYCRLEAGTYQLISNDASNRLYSITFQSSRATASGVEIDTTDMKKTYAIGDTLDTRGLKAYYIWEDGTKSLASISNISYRITDEN
ncbi:MAG: bacterial Ig-like domain-containing protein, partial [Anaeroplasmataceae bacterium]|nr:bacterial Ig-like domain-containing protein [Anaeroplasmataceae bacterium]